MAAGARGSVNIGIDLESTSGIDSFPNIIAAGVSIVIVDANGKLKSTICRTHRIVLGADSKTYENAWKEAGDEAIIQARAAIGAAYIYFHPYTWSTFWSKNVDNLKYLLDRDAALPPVSAWPLVRDDIMWAYEKYDGTHNVQLVSDCADLDIQSAEYCIEKYTGCAIKIRFVCPSKRHWLTHPSEQSAVLPNSINDAITAFLDANYPHTHDPGDDALRIAMWQALIDKNRAAFQARLEGVPLTFF